MPALQGQRYFIIGGFFLYGIGFIFIGPADFITIPWVFKSVKSTNIQSTIHYACTNVTMHAGIHMHMHVHAVIVLVITVKTLLKF